MKDEIFKQENFLELKECFLAAEDFMLSVQEKPLADTIHEKARRYVQSITKKMPKKMYFTDIELNELSDEVQRRIEDIRDKVITFTVDVAPSTTDSKLQNLIAQYLSATALNDALFNDPDNKQAIIAAQEFVDSSGIKNYYEVHDKRIVRDDLLQLQLNLYEAISPIRDAIIDYVTQHK